MEARTTFPIAGTGPNIHAAPATRRAGLDIVLAGDRAARGPLVSETWSVAGWCIQFARLASGQLLGLDESAGRHYVKVVTGELVNIDRRPFAGRFAVRETAVDVHGLKAGPEGAVFAVFTETDRVADNIHDMAALQIEGPVQDAFAWERFDEKFGAFTDLFDGMEAYMSPGIHLLDESGAEICYVNLWTCGKGVDLSTHNHAQDPSPEAPAFAETHWVFNNGAPGAGMYLCDEPGAPRRRFPMCRGQEHGPFFAIDETTRRPRMRPNGAVEYPWHGWQGGQDNDPAEAFDFVAAFETNPEHVLVT